MIQTLHTCESGGFVAITIFTIGALVALVYIIKDIRSGVLINGEYTVYMDDGLFHLIKGEKWIGNASRFSAAIKLIKEDANL